MLEIITDKKSITKFQMQFEARLFSLFNEKIKCKIGHLGYSGENVVFYSKKYDLWFTTHKNRNRFWNGFGVGRPSTGRNVSITVEINPPFKGINRRIGAVFARNEKGEVLVLHRGKIGGGRFGIGKTLFFENYRGDFEVANDGGVKTKFCVIGSLNSINFPDQISNFITEVARIKSLDKTKQSKFYKVKNFQFTAEISGKGTGKYRNKTIINRTHGIVVNALARKLEENGFNVANDSQRDLFIYKNNKIIKLFEFKTSSTTQDLFTAVGQLIIYSIPIKNPVQLFLVIPDKLKKEVEDRLYEMKINIIYYKWSNNDIVFDKTKGLVYQ